MDKNVLKKFAMESRQELMEKITNKINKFYVNEEFKENHNGDVYVLTNDKHTISLTKKQYENRQLLIKRIKEISLEQVIEEAAYTWFNRIIAIRYMEIHDYLPLTKDNQSLGIRVLSSKDNTPDPEIMKISNLFNPDLDIEFNKEYYSQIQDNNKRFEYILLLVCNKLGKVIPQVFDGETDYINILIPDNLLNDSGYITKVLKDVSEDNYEKVEIIGWLYQYYNQSEKDRVISAKKAYKKNEIPFATQLFTPEWIVKYMVENSLGKYWIEHGGDKLLINNWKYYIKDSIVQNNLSLDPKEIKCIDPCSGSGHILVYMFEVLYQIYNSYGYSKKDIPALILKYNLYGLDIDNRAGQLSVLSVILKAREFDKFIFNNDIISNLNILSIQETNNLDKTSIEWLKLEGNDIIEYELNEIIDYLYENFKNAKEIGSLLKIKEKNYSLVLNRIKDLNNTQLNLFDIGKIKEINDKFYTIIKQAIILSNKYNVVVTNPPYLNASLMTQNMKDFIKKFYNDFKADAFSAFISQMFNLTLEDGLIGTITPYVWMFITTYESLRNYITENKEIDSLIQLEYNSFEGACVPVATYIFRNTLLNKDGTYIRLSDYPGYNVQHEKVLEALNNNTNYMFKIKQNNFKKISGNVFGYWIPCQYFKIFENKQLNTIADAKKGISTSNNDLFLKLWHEVNIDKICFNSPKIKLEKKWYPLNKGGAFRRWYGNNDYIINWNNNGEDIKNYSLACIRNENFYLKESLTWTDLTNYKASFRYNKCGFIHDVAGPCIFNLNNNIWYIMGLLNSKVAEEIFKITAPTMHFNIGNIADFPIIIDENKKDVIEELVKENISLCKKDWDSYENSWDFKITPLLSNKTSKISNAINYVMEDTTKNFITLQKNEEKLNTIFIEIYKLNNILEPKVEERDISIRRFDNVKEIKNLISYAVGCMFGRYSLDKQGIVFAGGDFDSIYEKYPCQDLKDEVGQPLSGNNGGWTGVSLSSYKYLNINNQEVEIRYAPDLDNIIPITENSYFGDDIVTKFKEFIEIAYGKDDLYENLEYIAESLGKRNGESNEDTIRRYFINDFFNEHVKMYQKRPIYWLFDSGKKNGFKCLIYMHRYNKGTVSKIRLDYLHKMQNTYEKELNEINQKLSEDISLQEKKALTKKQADLNAKLQETNEYDEKIAHIADQAIEIDLDDGVAVNYAKFSVKNPKTGKEESILANSKDIAIKKKKEE